MVSNVKRWPVLISLCLAAAHAQANANDMQQRKALEIARKYSEAVSCQIEQPASIIKLRGSDEQGIGSLYLAYWVGDKSCFGGKGSVFANYALVAQTGYFTVDPVIVGSDDGRYRMPEMTLNRITRVSVKDGYLYVSGIGYGDKDEPGWPKTEKSYKIPISRFVSER